MKFHQNKIIHKVVLLAIILANFALIPLANAQTCTDLNQPDKIDKWIVTILEEQIGSPKGTTASESFGGDTTIVNCLRCAEKCKGNASGTDTLCPTYKALSDIPADAICQRVQVFFSKSGAGLMYAYIGLVYKWAAGVIGIVCVLFLVLGGVQIAAAGDNTGKIDEAKQRIIQSIAGLVLLFLSAIILYTINPNFFTFS
jgi:hypothetical protein